jgi:hypothetical protein
MKTLFVGSLFIVVMTTSALAQQRPPAPPQTPQPQAQPQPPAPPAPQPGADQPNIRFDITINDDGVGTAPVRKVVMLLVQGGGSASLRSQAEIAGSRFARSLNVDIRLAPYIQTEGGRMRGRIAIEYQPAPAAAVDNSGPGIRAQVDAQFVDGKKLVLWQAADPGSERRTTVEVTATLLK